MKKAIYLAVVMMLTLALAQNAQTLELTAPNNGGAWMQGVTLHITWTASGLGGSNRLELWKGTSKTGVIAQNLGAGPGDHPWKVGELIGAPIAIPGTNYKIKVVNSGGMEDASNANFAITAGVQLVTSANTLANPQPSAFNRTVKKPAGPNLQLPSYANIISFKVNGQSTSSNTNRIPCHRGQQTVLYANAVSSVAPISYRFVVEITNPFDGYPRDIYDSNWTSQNQVSFTMTYAQALAKIFPNGIPEGQTIYTQFLGLATVYAKNDSQTEPHKFKTHAIKYFID